MSYSGFTERLCLNGHYSAHDVWGEEPDNCGFCGAFFRFIHGVDQTNGYDESHPATCRAPKIEYATEDVWREDHLGNRYATRLPRYAIVGEGAWIKVNSRGHATPPYDDDLARIEAGTDETRNAAQPEGREPEKAPNPTTPTQQIGN